MSYELERDAETVSSFCNIAREIICNYIVRNNSRIGGLDENNQLGIVEIDESNFFKEKYN
jgi:hypothetical protein